MSTLLPSASAIPFVINGTAVTPPVPLDTVVPAPSRLIHPSRVNCAAPSPSAWPKVMRLVEPLNLTAVFA